MLFRVKIRKRTNYPTIFHMSCLINLVISVDFLISTWLYNIQNCLPNSKKYHTSYQYLKVCVKAKNLFNLLWIHSRRLYMGPTTNQDVFLPSSVGRKHRCCVHNFRQFWGKYLSTYTCTVASFKFLNYFLYNFLPSFYLSLYCFCCSRIL